MGHFGENRRRNAKGGEISGILSSLLHKDFRVFLRAGDYAENGLFCFSHVRVQRFESPHLRNSQTRGLIYRS